MGGVLTDLRYAARLLGRRPGITAAIVLTLALAIGANTAIFSIVDAVLFGRLPIPEGDRVVALYTLDAKNPGHLPVSDLNQKDIDAQANDVLDVATFSFHGAEIGIGDELEQVGGHIVTSDYFRVLRVGTAVGRTFEHDDDALGAHPEIVLSHEWWTQKFAADPDVVGRTLLVDGRPMTVIGVTQEGFTGTTLFRAAYFVPYSSHRELAPAAPWYGNRRWLAFQPIARLRDGVTLEQANAELDAIGGRLAADYPDTNGGRTFTAVPCNIALMGPDQREVIVTASTLLMTVVGFVLVIACANAANLMLARAATRRAEIALRGVLGARPGRLVRQMLTESLLLAAIAASVGLVLAVGVRDFVWAMRPPNLQLPGIEPTIDGHVLGFTLVLALVTGIAFGIVPALRAARIDLLTPLKQEAGTAGGTARVGLRGALVVVQVALSMIALVGGGLFIRSMQNVREVDPGFAADEIVIANVDFGRGDGDPALEVVRRRELVGVLRALPEVRDAELAGGMPFTGALMRRTAFVDGRDVPDAEDGVLFDVSPVGERYFSMMGLEILRGRAFSADDILARPRVAIVNETFAQRFWTQRDPLGERLRFMGEKEPLTVVGIVANSKYAALTEDPNPVIYVPLEQWPQANLFLGVRVDDPTTAAPAIEAAVAGLGNGPRLANAEPYAELLENAVLMPKLGATLLGAFAGLALLLASIGIHGVMSYNVQLRTREIGIRMALGATPSRVRRQVMLEAMTLVGVGIGFGVLGGVLLQTWLADLLFQVGLADPWAFLGAAAVLAGWAALAAWWPAREATRVDPTVAMRHG
ncbi:MAG TPA: ABC transporter permease [Nannocystaceae bacterium]|nr:ABC transporter permease [Nannocystaceae bacterium]